MNIQELAAYNSDQQAQFQPTLNPHLWTPREHLKTPVHNSILFGAEEYCASLGLAEHQVQDVVISGAMAGYSHNNTADIDVIIVADLNPDPTFREFFTENCHSYNQQSTLKIGQHAVKFYVHPAEEKITSRGTYSLLSESWLQVAQRRLTEDTDTVMAFKRAEQAAQPAPSKPVQKKRVVREHQPTVYGFSREDINEVALTPDGVSATTCQFTNEQAPPSNEETLIDFVKFCSDQLGLENEPVLKIRKDPEWSRRNKTFGRFNGGTGQLEVSVAGRHMMDVLRTIAHELTHQHQHEREDVPEHAGETGSEWENEANARAGVLMRDYGQENPHLFADSDELNENWKKWAAGGLAAAALMGAPSPAQGQSIQQGLGAVQTIGTMYNTLKNTNIPAMLQGEAQAELLNFITANGGNPNAQNQSTLYQWQKKYQQSKQQQAQTQQASDSDSSQYTQQTIDPQLAAQGDMYSQQLQQHQASQAKTNESASGYIPTKKQAKDPRYSMALTKDIKPGTLGKVANAFMLNTDSQGRPQEANPNGTVKRLKEELEFIKLTEAADAEIDNLTVDQMLDYANRMHKAGFQNGVMIKKHPRWKLTTLPIGVLQLKDPGRKDIDNDHVGTITEIDLETKPIIVGSRGVIIDGNHRARRAFELGIDSLPAFVPKL
jgi:hypothetical protein